MEMSRRGSGRCWACSTTRPSTTTSSTLPSPSNASPRRSERKARATTSPSWRPSSLYPRRRHHSYTHSYKSHQRIEEAGSGPNMSSKARGREGREGRVFVFVFVVFIYLFIYLYIYVNKHHIYTFPVRNNKYCTYTIKLVCVFCFFYLWRPSWHVSAARSTHPPLQTHRSLSPSVSLETLLLLLLSSEFRGFSCGSGVASRVL